MNRVMGKIQDEDLYDEIPFSTELLADEGGFGGEPPPPIPKKHHHEVAGIDLPPSPLESALDHDFNSHVQTIDMLKTQHPVGFDDSSSFSSSATDNDDEKEIRIEQAARSRIGSTRSRVSGYRSARESRSRPASPQFYARRKSCGGQRDFDDVSYFEYGASSKYSTTPGYDARPDYGTLSNLMKRRKSLKSLGSLTSQVQQFLGKSESALHGLNSERLLFW